jgi:hypothetical protein
MSFNAPPVYTYINEEEDDDDDDDFLDDLESHIGGPSLAAYLDNARDVILDDIQQQPYYHRRSSLLTYIILTNTTIRYLYNSASCIHTYVVYLRK